MEKKCAVFIILAILIAIFTYPFIFSIAKDILGFASTDEPYGFLWDYWRIKYSLLHKISITHVPFTAYPYGLDSYSSGYVAYIWLGLACILSLFSSPVFALNIQLFVNLFLTGIFTYLLAERLNNNFKFSFFSCVIFTFCPFLFMRMWQHPGITYLQWIPFCIFAAIKLREEYSKKNAGLFFLSLLLLFSFDWSVMYIGAISLIGFFIYCFFYNWRAKLSNDRKAFIAEVIFFKRVFFIGIFFLLVLSFQLLPILKNIFKLSKTSLSSAYNPYHRPFDDLFAQSARPLSYILPSAVHPVFGKFTENFVGTSLYGTSFTEHTIYLGWVPLIFAFVAVRRWRKNRKRAPVLPAGRQEHKSTRTQEQEKEDFYIGFFVFLAIMGWLFSQPPWWQIGSIKIYMPSFFMYKILPMFRAYCRFGIVVMLAVAILAGVGLKFILGRFKKQSVKIALVIFFYALVLFEFWNWPPYKVIDVSKVPAVYYWLKELPGDFVIAEYPSDADSPNELRKFYQTKHEKKIINGTIPGTHANKVAQSIKKLSDLKTARVLKWMDVKYVLVHHEDYLKTDFIDDKEELEKIPKNHGLKLISSFPPQECPNKAIMCVQKTGPIDVYEVIAMPSEPKIKDQ